MKALARNIVWWPGDIQDRVEQCSMCQDLELANKALVSQLGGKMFLIVIDARLLLPSKRCEHVFLKFVAHEFELFCKRNGIRVTSLLKWSGGKRGHSTLSDRLGRMLFEYPQSRVNVRTTIAIATPVSRRKYK